MDPMQNADDTGPANSTLRSAACADTFRSVWKTLQFAAQKIGTAKLDAAKCVCADTLIEGLIRHGILDFGLRIVRNGTLLFREV